MNNYPGRGGASTRPFSSKLFVWLWGLRYLLLPPAVYYVLDPLFAYPDAAFSLITSGSKAAMQALDGAYRSGTVRGGIKDLLIHHEIRPYGYEDQETIMGWKELENFGGRQTSVEWWGLPGQEPTLARAGNELPLEGQQTSDDWSKEDRTWGDQVNEHWKNLEGPPTPREDLEEGFTTDKRQETSKQIGNEGKLENEDSKTPYGHLGAQRQNWEDMLNHGKELLEDDIKEAFLLPKPPKLIQKLWIVWKEFIDGASPEDQRYYYPILNVGILGAIMVLFMYTAKYQCLNATCEADRKKEKETNHRLKVVIERLRLEKRLLRREQELQLANAIGENLSEQEERLRKEFTVSLRKGEQRLRSQLQSQHLKELRAEEAKRVKMEVERQKDIDRAVANGIKSYYVTKEDLRRRMDILGLDDPELKEKGLDDNQRIGGELEEQLEGLKRDDPMVTLLKVHNQYRQLLVERHPHDFSQLDVPYKETTKALFHLINKLQAEMAKQQREYRQGGKEEDAKVQREKRNMQTEHRNEVSRLKAEADKYRKKVDGLTKDLNKARGLAGQGLQTTVTAELNYKEKLDKAKSNHDAEVKRLEGQIKQLTEDKGELLRTLSGIEDTYKALRDEEKRKYQEAIQALEKDYRNQVDTCTIPLIESLKNEKEAFKTLEQKAQDLSNKNQTLAAQNSELKAQNSQLERQNAEIQTQLRISLSQSSSSRTRSTSAQQGSQAPSAGTSARPQRTPSSSVSPLEPREMPSHSQQQPTLANSFSIQMPVSTQGTAMSTVQAEAIKPDPEPSRPILATGTTETQEKSVEKALRSEEPMLDTTQQQQAPGASSQEAQSEEARVLSQKQTTPAPQTSPQSTTSIHTPTTFQPSPVQQTVGGASEDTMANEEGVAEEANTGTSQHQQRTEGATKETDEEKLTTSSTLLTAIMPPTVVDSRTQPEEAAPELPTATAAIISQDFTAQSIVPPGASLTKEAIVTSHNDTSETTDSQAPPRERVIPSSNQQGLQSSVHAPARTDIGTRLDDFKIALTPAPKPISTPSSPEQTSSQLTPSKDKISPSIIQSPIPTGLTAAEASQDKVSLTSLDEGRGASAQGARSVVMETVGGATQPHRRWSIAQTAPRPTSRTAFEGTTNLEPPHRRRSVPQTTQEPSRGGLEESRWSIGTHRTPASQQQTRSNSHTTHHTSAHGAHIQSFNFTVPSSEKTLTTSQEPPKASEASRQKSRGRADSRSSAASDESSSVTSATPPRRQEDNSRNLSSAENTMKPEKGEEKDPKEEPTSESSK